MLNYIEECEVPLYYACRIYAPEDSKERTWTPNGFSNWNVAKTPKKGLRGHCSSDTHINAEKTWDEHKLRKKSSKLVETLVVVRVPEQIWVEAVFNLVRFLATIGLPFRRHDEKTDFTCGTVSGGIYLNTFSQLLFQIKPELFKISQRLPENAKYTSPDVQNEIVIYDYH